MPLGGGANITRGSVCILICVWPLSAGSSSVMGVNGEPGCGSSEVEPDIKSGELEVLEAEAGAGALDDTERFV